MIVIDAGNVNDAYRQGWDLLDIEGKPETSRNGDVLVLPYPVMTIYQRPRERVLFDAKRNANPYFHLMEAIWMLAGRDDADFLNTFVHDFGDRYAQSDGHLWGAYGYRWRNHFGLDQLVEVIERLCSDPSTRQAVIAMWNPNDDLPKDDVWPEPVKDRPCNTHIYFRVRGGLLDMTVCCRSNDMIWGAYGANAVHFSVLQEFVALAIGKQVGRYYQLSNNFHVYVETMNKIGSQAPYNPYASGEAVPYERIGKAEHWRIVLKEFEEFVAAPSASTRSAYVRDVLQPMYRSWMAVKEKDYIRAAFWANQIAAKDWSLACNYWIKRKMK